MSNYDPITPYRIDQVKCYIFKYDPLATPANRPRPA